MLNMKNIFVKIQSVDSRFYKVVFLWRDVGPVELRGLFEGIDGRNDVPR